MVSPPLERNISDNVSLVNVTWKVMILLRTNPLQGSLEGVGHENLDFFWALKWHLSYGSALPPPPHVSCVGTRQSPTSEQREERL
jgi:hypothetical protein